MQWERLTTYSMWYGTRRRDTKFLRSPFLFPFYLPFYFLLFSYSLTLFTSGFTIFTCVLGVLWGEGEDIRQAKVQDHEDC